jgi:hypothetical protein
MPFSLPKLQPRWHNSTFKSSKIHSSASSWFDPSSRSGTPCGQPSVVSMRLIGAAHWTIIPSHWVIAQRKSVARLQRMSRRCIIIPAQRFWILCTICTLCECWTIGCKSFSGILDSKLNLIFCRIHFGTTDIFGYFKQCAWLRTLPTFDKLEAAATTLFETYVSPRAWYQVKVDVWDEAASDIPGYIPKTKTKTTPTHSRGDAGRWPQ